MLLTLVLNGTWSLCFVQVVDYRTSSVTTPVTAPAYNSLSGKKQFDNQRNTSSLGVGTRSGYSQAFGTISASELASLQDKKVQET